LWSITTPQNSMNDLEQLKIEVEGLKRLMREHLHDGVESREVSISNLVDMVQIVSTAPATTPRRFEQQFKIYTSGSTYRLYWYDQVNAAWHYVTATA